MRGLARLLARRRRVLAAIFAAGTVGFALPVLRPQAPPAVRVPTAARDLPAGTTLRTGDLRMIRLPPAAVPDGVLPARPARGRVLAGAVRRGEPITDARLLTGGLLDRYGPGTVATPVRIADPGAVRLLRPGDRVDVLAAPSADPAVGGIGVPGAASGARTLVSSVPVLAVPRESAGSGGRAGMSTTRSRVFSPDVSASADDPAAEGQEMPGALIVLATARHQAAILAGVHDRLSITITGETASTP